MKAIYTIPKLVKPKDTSKSWYVYFRYNKELCRYKFDYNNIKDLSEREYEFKIACAYLLTKLKDGWNPKASVKKNSVIEYTLTEALDFALGKKKSNISNKTYLDYDCTIRFVKTAIIELSLTNLKVKDVKRVHIKMIFEKIKLTRCWTNKSYNKNLSYVKAVLGELLQWDIIESNPASKIDKLDEEASFANTPASLSDIKLIKEELIKNHINFYVYIITIFHTGIRPVEILRLTLEMIDLQKSEITLPGEITKNKKRRVVPINPFLANFYREMNFSELSKEYYLFGSHKIPKKAYKKTEPMFIPGPKNITRNDASNYWKNVVKDALGIQMNMYAMKHFGADQKILAGISLETLKELYGHSSTLMTETYAKKIKEVYRRQIIDQSPDF